MSKGGGSKPAPAPKQEQGDPFVSGFVPYPKDGQFPIQAQSNYWENGQFKAPGFSQPLMASSLLERFPQLQGVFGGITPGVTNTTDGRPQTPSGQIRSVGQVRNPPTSSPTRRGSLLNLPQVGDFFGEILGSTGGRDGRRSVLDTGAKISQGLLGWQDS